MQILSNLLNSEISLERKYAGILERHSERSDMGPFFEISSLRKRRINTLLDRFSQLEIPAEFPKIIKDEVHPENEKAFSSSKEMLDMLKRMEQECLDLYFEILEDEKLSKPLHHLIENELVPSALRNLEILQTLSPGANLIGSASSAEDSR